MVLAGATRGAGLWFLLELRKELGCGSCLSISICWRSRPVATDHGFNCSRVDFESKLVKRNKKIKEWDLGSTPTPPPFLSTICFVIRKKERKKENRTNY